MNATTFKHKPLFPLGLTVSTPGALRALSREGICGQDLLRRHQCGDWSEMAEDDRRENLYATDQRRRVFSSYVLPRTGVKLWIITEADRSVTTILLPIEY